jgi:hypothetical protein
VPAAFGAEVRSQLSPPTRRFVVTFAFVAAAAACTSPEQTEETLAACHDGVDNDDAGGADCADEKCARFCETSESACGNDLDDDGDGLVDCLDPECRGLFACATVDASCDPWTSAGCSGGRACFETDPLRGSGSYCAVPGPAGGVMGSACEAHEDCPAQLACVANRCVRRCLDHRDCPRESACIKGASVGLCTLPCVPAAGPDACSPGYCRPFSEAGYLGLPQLFFCDGAPLIGKLLEGATCEDVPGATPKEACATGALCVPERGLPYGRGRCRETCALDEGGAVTIPCARADRACVLGLPDDPRMSLPGRPLVGLCLPKVTP